ncbi:MAG TPA: FAD-binding oxidoreductase [Vitreimonas sp.]|uniref:NAD(P)/FAD-dependent oxidoreductase n=1 Tax=Vitreimonas sp. TaxID=3069702 RepID=UPI002D6E59D5|nr:FAD-binding oxidoreductase [Vitreimonas sp.]HYD87860.1 FAD-binding oxidoreductase [Vitreimonas sp.]
MKSIIVIGGGLVGASAALRLQLAGIATTLVDPGDVRRAASFGNAGHIGTEQVSPWSSWENVRRSPRSSFLVGGPLDFRWRDAAMVAPWTQRFLASCGPAAFARGQAALAAILTDAMGAWHRIAALAGEPDLVIPHGHATVWMSHEAAERGRGALGEAPAGPAKTREMTRAELDRYASVLRATPAAGVLFEGTGQVSEPQAVRDAIFAAFVNAGGEIVADSAAHVSADGRVTLGSGGVRKADAILIAAGAWSGELMRQLGAATPLIGERGYHLQSAETDWPFDLPTTVFEETFVIFSRFTSGLRATSFLEFGSPGAPGDARKWRLLQRRIADLGVRFSATPERWVGARPTLPDYVPAIGRLARAPNVFYAFGHAHLGLTMAPITAELVLALATEQTPSIDLAPFKIERFG